MAGKRSDRISSCEVEKDIEQYGNDTSPRRPHSSAAASMASIDYREGTRRISTILDPEIIRIATRASRISGKPSRDLEEILNTEFEVKWDGPNDPLNALNWSKLRKYLILVLVSLQAWMVYVYSPENPPFKRRGYRVLIGYIFRVFFSTSYISGAPGMMKEFGITSNTTITLGMTTYMLGLAVGPLVLAPMSELFGRRPVYLISLSLFFILVLPACLARNFATILVVRFFWYAW